MQGNKDLNVFSSSQQFYEAQSKVPVVPRPLDDEGSTRYEKQTAEKKDTKTKVEKLMRTIDQRVEMSDNNIVDESIKRSMYGIFTQTYHKIKSSTDDLEEIFKSYFKGSQILNDVQSKTFL